MAGRAPAGGCWRRSKNSQMDTVPALVGITPTRLLKLSVCSFTSRKTSTIGRSIWLLTILIGGPAVSGTALSVPPTDVALLVEVSNYKNHQRFPALKGSDAAMSWLEDALVTHNFKVDRVTDPNQRNFRDELEKFLRKDARRSFFFFIGHGKDKAQAEDRETSYLLLTDATSNPEDGGWFGLDKLVDLLNKTRAEKLLVVLDACFAGRVMDDLRSTWFGPEQIVRKVTADRRSNGGDESIESILSKVPAVTVITSGGAEKVPEGSDFGKSLACSLAGRADQPPKDGVVTSEEIVQYVRRNIEGDERTEPEYLRSRENDITFTVPTGNIAAAANVRPKMESCALP